MGWFDTFSAGEGPACRFPRRITPPSPVVDCPECEEAKIAQQTAPAPSGNVTAPECVGLYELVDACMKRDDRQSVKECAKHWKAFNQCHKQFYTKTR